MKKTKYIFLSYLLNEELTAFADGKRLEIDEVSKISSGDSSNNTEIHLPTHFGTHIDFPYHFSDNGKKVETYPADYFVFDHVQFVDIQDRINDNDIININHFNNIYFNPEAELLLVKTGYYEFRNQKKYWNENPAFHSDLAIYLKDHLPKLRTIGFDTISLSSWNKRTLGREAHKTFLIENDILLIEDMDLSELDSTSKFEKVIVAPLRVSGLEGAPVTVLAEIN